jgi:Icc protein
MRLIHLSDTHIAADTAFESYGHAPYSHLVALVDHLNHLPYDYDCIIHTGDVVEDESEQAYHHAQPILNRLRKPIYYLSGNHDNPQHLQRLLVGIQAPAERYVHAFQVKGVQFVALDTSSDDPPSGIVPVDQLDFLRGFCAVDGPPLVLLVHHLPVSASTSWLERGASYHPHMLIENRGELINVLKPALGRLRGVLFGHVHRAIQTFQHGIFFSSAPSTFGQLKTYPESTQGDPAPEEAPGYALVCIDEGESPGMQVQHYTFTRPRES